MNKKDSATGIGRRDFLALSGTLLAAGGFSSMLAADGRLPERSASSSSTAFRYSLDLGFRAPRSGPVTTLKNGDILWLTTDPEAPYLSRSMWSISRIAMRRSQDGGKSWGNAIILERGTKDHSVMSFGLRRLHSGKLLHVFAHSGGYDYETGSPERSLRELFFNLSADEGKTWTKAQKIDTGERYQGDVLSFEQLRNGRIIYPFCFLTNVRSQFAISVMFSEDEGKKWTRSKSILTTGGGGFESGASEPTVAELKNGRLWMLIRSQTGVLWESFSDDRGETWTPARESQLPSSNAPATALRMSNGDIAVAWNPHITSNYARQSLVVGITSDGQRFHGLRELDLTDFTDDPAASIPHVTYPYLTETKEGDLGISYNKGNWSRHNRPTFARIGTDWLTGKSEVFDLTDGRTGWHTIDPGPKLSAAQESYVLQDGELLLHIERHKNNKVPTGIIRNVPLVTDGQITVSMRAAGPEAYLLFGNSLLDPRDPTEGCLRVRFDGSKIYLAAGSEQNTQNNRRTTEYHYRSHKIKDEVEYPQTFKAGEILEISVRYKAETNEAQVSIKNGERVTLKMVKMLGISYMGLLVGEGGQIGFRSVKTTRNK